MPNKTYELRKLFFQQNTYSPACGKKYSMVSLPEDWNFKPLKEDVELLDKNLKASPEKYQSVAQQVFGLELKKHYTHLRHIANLLTERAQLHKRHLKEIDKRHIEAQEKMFGAQINHTSDRNKRISSLEGQLAQLEKERRDEELDFWKDTVDIRQQLFENGWQYRDSLQRTQVFSDVEAHHDR